MSNVGDMIGDINVRTNADRIIKAVGNVNEWRAYARKLEQRISELEVELKEMTNVRWATLLASIYRKSVFQASQLWMQQYNEMPVHPDIIVSGKNKFKNFIVTNDDRFLKLVAMAYRINIAEFANRTKSDDIYIAFEDGKNNVSGIIKETGAKAWELMKSLENNSPVITDKELVAVEMAANNNEKSTLKALADLML